MSLLIPKILSSSIGASTIIRRNEVDLQLFLTMKIKPSTYNSATPSHLLFKTHLFLIDAGATHNVLSETYANAKSKVLMQFAIMANQSILSFDGTQSKSCFEIDLTIESSPTPSRFIIKKFKM